MRILLVAATSFEIEQLFSKYNFSYNEEKEIYFYENDRIKINILITGIGIAFTTYKLTKLLLNSEKKYNLVLNIGIAGSFNRKLYLGEVINVVQDEFADLAIENSDGSLLSIFGTNFANKNEFPFTEGKIKNRVLFNKLVSNLPQKTAITVNTTHGSEKSIGLFKEKYKADLESMEGAAVFYVCLKEKTPVLQIRSISNYVEPRNKENWKIKEAVTNLNNFLIELLIDSFA